MNTLSISLIYFLLSITLAADFSASQILFQIQERDLICPTDSALRILSANADVYVASIDEKIIVKIGPRLDIGKLVPPAFKIATSGKDYTVWEKKE
ncbi:unnamed protein product [Prunus armeniaca]|uniref:alpha-amylase n=1 Tax=Prunus armeniaca TaxID=36596 RepID=A0A6J5UZC3_PRUAR|nr:unnamed protein product [Prunus armeniaca]CAB4311187.1 unnamed protein product [Prunus armeniaca]